MKKSIFFYKELTLAEVGKTGTHEIYVRLPNNFDFKTFFGNTAVENGSVLEVNFTAIDTTDDGNDFVKLRFVYFKNSNQEKRIPSLGELFKSHNVKEGNIVCLERREEDSEASYFIHFYKAGEIKISPNSVYFMRIGDEKIGKDSSRTRTPRLHQIPYNSPDTEYIISYLTALRTKPFMLLAGISGTGKSRIVRKLAQATTTQQYDNDDDRWKDNRPENFELIQVKPNWHNSMDVVGFYSNISKKYEYTPFVEFIVKAWQHKDTPYFLCLDEMNLAPVEEYFAEFLSAIESRSTDENGEYITDPIIKPFKEFGKDVCEDMLKHLLGEAHHTESNPLAEQFTKKGLTLPPNLMVMGTVNMDETTFSFSRKVLDRAMSMEMNEVDYDKFLSGESEQFPLLKDINDLLVKRPQLASEVKEEIDSAKVIGYLKDVNNLLDGTPFKLGYRAANEAMLYVAASRDFAGEKFSIEKALDEFTLMKILSRIEGDDNRLTVDENDLVLETIGKDSITDAGEDRINLLNCLRAIVRENIGSNTETEKKINIMYRTLEREHFVSYWA